MTTKAERRRAVTNRTEAMRHPIRAEALEYLNTYGVASPQEIADKIGEDVSNVSYHVRRLVELDCAELVSTEPVRGATRHNYRAVQPHVLEAEDFAGLPEEVRRSNVVECVELQLADYRTALADGSLGRDEKVAVLRVPLRGIDREGQQEVLEIIERAFEEISDVPVRSHERIQESGEKPIRLAVALNAFEVSSF